MAEPFWAATLTRLDVSNKWRIPGRLKLITGPKPGRHSDMGERKMSMPPSYPPAPGQPPVPPGNGGVGAIGKHRNPFLVWLVWPLITLGIYHLVWWYKINREVRDFDQRIEVDPGVAVLALFPGAFILVPPYVSVWKTGDRIGRAQGAGRQPDPCNPWIGLILAFILGLHSLYYQICLNSLWASYGTPPEGTEVQLRA
jgi:hypothetical protein